MNGEVIVVDDVAAEFAERVVEAFLGRPGDGFSLVLSGGSTARRCYERLASDAADEIDWWQVDIYWGDERCVSPDSPDSNERLVRESLLERVGAANAVYPMRCEEGPDPYQQRIAEAGRLDFVHLGLGPDGHTASLFPGSAALDVDPGRLVVMNEDPAGRNPYRRMTLTFSGIARARLVVFTVSGAEKRDAFAAVQRGDAECPAARVRAERIVWLVDAAAAGRNGARDGGSATADPTADPTADRVG
jgi:6-phosphogluconolactonase